MNAEQARELAFSAMELTNGIAIEIEMAAKQGNFRCYVPKRGLYDWDIQTLQNRGYQVIERAFEYEINWDN